MVRIAAGAVVGSPDRTEYIPEAGEVRRRRNTCPDYGIRKFCGISGNRVQKRGTGLWNRMQDIYDSRAGHSVRHRHKLGAGSGILDIESVRRFVVQGSLGRKGYLLLFGI